MPSPPPPPPGEAEAAPPPPPGEAEAAPPPPPGEAEAAPPTTLSNGTGTQSPVVPSIPPSNTVHISVMPIGIWALLSTRHHPDAGALKRSAIAVSLSLSFCSFASFNASLSFAFPLSSPVGTSGKGATYQKLPCLKRCIVGCGSDSDDRVASVALAILTSGGSLYFAYLGQSLYSMLLSSKEPRFSAPVPPAMPGDTSARLPARSDSRCTISSFLIFAAVPAMVSGVPPTAAAAARVAILSALSCTERALPNADELALLGLAAPPIPARLLNGVVASPPLPPALATCALSAST